MRRLATLVLVLLLAAGCAGAGVAPRPLLRRPDSLCGHGSARRSRRSARSARPDRRRDRRGQSDRSRPGDGDLPGPAAAEPPAAPDQPGRHRRAHRRRARSAGLLDGPTDLTGGLPPGGQTAHLLFVIDGVEREVLGDPTRQIVCITTPCDGAPGTPGGVRPVLGKDSRLGSWLGNGAGPRNAVRRRPPRRSPDRAGGRRDR